MREGKTPTPLHALLTRRDFLRLLLTSGGAVALSPMLNACSGAGIVGATETSPGLLDGLEGLDIAAFFEESFRRWFIRDPEILTSLSLADSYGVGDASLTDISDAYLRETQSLEAGVLDLLRGYDRASFSATQALTGDVYDWFLDDLVRGHPFLYDSYPVNPSILSVPYTLVLLFTVWHPLNNRQDADDYIARLSQIGTKMTQLIDGLRRRQERGVILPAVLIPTVKADIDMIGYDVPPSHPFYAAFADRLTGVSDDERQILLEQVTGQINEVVSPAYHELSAFLRAAQSVAPADVGVWQFSDGAAYYAQCLRHHTTTELTADEIHELGLQNVERIHAEMRPLFAELGYASEASIPDLLQQMEQSGGYYGGQEAVDAYEEAIRGAEALLPEAFDIFPEAEVIVVGGRAGDYYDPAPYDGSRPGIFYASIEGGTPQYGVKTLAYHEAVPGHHLQVMIGLEQTHLPTLHRNMQFSAFVEGWALYAERLMWELGVYADDPQGNLGRLRSEVYRAARLVVDTGIHAKRWTFDQATEYLAEAAGLAAGWASGEVARYSAVPAQAVSYYVGFQKILDLRRRAQEALGDRFDLKSFHRTVLQNGALPLSILESQVEASIARGG